MADLEERSEYLVRLNTAFSHAVSGEGHTVFLMGEAGIGKTSLVNHFLRQLPKGTTVLSGACDPLSTPRPLGPLYDIAAQLGSQFQSLLNEEKKRHIIFSSLIEEITSLKSVVIVFEDVHWADEATIDLIKFLSRRIYRYHCLFLLTLRDDEIESRHALKNIFGELVPHTFSKVQVQRLSLKAVQQLATKHGNRSAQQLYELTGGNPFYVTEILANNETAIPDRVKDSILATFNSKDERMREFLKFLSILPARIERDVADRLEEESLDLLDLCLSSGIIVSRNGSISFKHELFRITIEDSMSSSRKKSLHRRMLSLIDVHKFKSVSLSQVVYHAEEAEEKELISQIAPRAAEEASSVGAHAEAAKLYDIALKFVDNTNDERVVLYERHAYECYLTNQLPKAIQSQQKALELWRKRKLPLKEGDALRFLSRLWWFSGNRANAMVFAQEAIEILENGFPTRERALAYSNLAQLYMLSDEREKALEWGNRAVELASRMHDDEIVSHALNNIGCAMMRFSNTTREGEETLRKSLSIALKNDLHEHAARAYTNLSFSLVLARRYSEAEKIFTEGFRYCEDRDLNSWSYYMQSERIKLLLETGKWNEAETLSSSLESYANHPAMVRISALVTLAKLRTRKGDFDDARKYLLEAHGLASMTGESQRIVPVLAAQLELSWIGGDPVPENEIMTASLNLFVDKKHSYHYFMLSEWAQRLGLTPAADHELTIENMPYEQALRLFELGGDDRKTAVHLLDSLGAKATLDKLRGNLKEQGVKNIPRGLRESTKSNPFQLTNRQIDVLNLLSQGLQNAEIADRLFISAKTVDHHISAILEKLDVNSRTKAVSKAQQLGLLAK